MKVGRAGRYAPPAIIAPCIKFDGISSITVSAQELQVEKMPNSGMLDHVGFRPSTGRRDTYVHWMDAWPTKVGYQTPRTFKISEFSRHMIKQTRMEVCI